ncbi:MAG: class I SAM-dependent methyltransferase [Steroidobacteraceae bacterium]
MTTRIPTSRNPHLDQMADESMVRTLAAQIAAIWPQEQPLLARYQLPREPRILDVGCGTGEFTARAAALWPAAQVIGVDILEEPLRLARSRHAPLGERVRFEHGDAYQLGFPDASFDLVACRHVTQAIPSAELVHAELVRVARPGGWVHVLAEDYTMVHMMSGPLDSDTLWRHGTTEFAARTGTDARIGRRTWSMLNALGLQVLRVDYVVVDTLRVPRETFAQILTAWRDGYAPALAHEPHFPESLARRHFDEIIASVRNPHDYAVWFVPIVSGRKPG